MPVESTATEGVGPASHRRLWVAVAVVACVFAYRGLLAGGLDLAGPAELQLFLFAPSHLSPLMLVAVAGWLVWNRRGAVTRLVPGRGLPDRSRTGLAWALWLAGLALLGWASVSRMGHLLLPSLALVLLAWAAREGGVAGCRAMLLPAALLAFGQALPTALLDEVIWRLQNLTAGGATWLLQTVGLETQRSGTILVRPLGRFEVIDACSGLRGLQLLMLVGLIVRDLFGRGGGRGWLPVVVAPVLAVVLNVVRVAIVAASPDPAALEAAGNDHTLQGLAVVFAGTLLLYGLGFVARARPDAAGEGEGKGESAGEHVDVSAGSSRDPRMLAAAAFGLAILSLAGVAFESRGAAPRPPPLAMPMQAGVWTGENIDIDVLFYGVPPGSPSILLRRYETTTGRGVPFAVELFVGRDGTDIYRRSSFFTSKFDRPGAEWEVVDAQPTRIWVLDVEAELIVVRRPLDGRWAIAYRFDLADAGRLRSAFRSYLGLDVARGDAAERLTFWIGTAIPSDSSVDRGVGQKRVERFIKELRSDLASLERGA